jgi:hypothetical protein
MFILCLSLQVGSCSIESLEGERQLDLKVGYVGNQGAKALRDTGCELAV